MQTYVNKSFGFDYDYIDELLSIYPKTYNLTAEDNFFRNSSTHTSRKTVITFQVLSLKADNNSEREELRNPYKP